MGNQQCEECRELKQQNSAYGQFQVCQLQGRQVAYIEKKLENQPGLSERIHEELHKRAALHSKHVVRLLKFEIQRQEYHLAVGLYYEYVPKTLRECLEEMQFRGEEFTEKQLFGVLYGVEDGLIALDEAGISHGCVNLQTVVSRNGVFKVTDVSSTTYLSSYELVLQGDRQQFLSEKLLNNLNYKIIKPTDRAVEDDLFSLGLIVLLLATRSKPSDFYNWHRSQKLCMGTFNSKHIEHSLRHLTRNFSSKLTAKVRAFLFPAPTPHSHPPSHTSPSSNSLQLELRDLQEDMNRVMSKINPRSATAPSKESSLRSSTMQPFR